jgi:PAS domain S-box-containing protein
MTAVEGIDLFAALNATSTGVVLLAPEGTTRYANAAALRLFGRPSSDGRRPDLLQSVAYEAINLDRRRLAQDPDLHEALTALRSLSTAGVIGLPSPVHGQVAWVCVAVSPIPADATRGGSPDWIVTITDGTDLASARERARVSNDRLTLALRAGNLGLWDWDLVSGMLHLDGRAAATFGLGSAELDVPQTTISALVAPQDIARIDETIHEHLRGTVSRTEVTYRVRSAQGGYGTWVCSAGAVAATDPSGRARRIVGTVRDVTAAKALEEALIESEQRYRLIAEHACDIVARLSCSGEILYISPAAETLFGVAPEHLASRRISSVARREYQGIVRDSVERCVNRRTPTDVTFQVDVPGFGIRSFEMSLRHVAPVEDSRTGASLVAIIRDFTSRLRDIERMNRLGGILDRAHDLVLTACPIAGVITYANRSARDKLALDLVAGLGLTMGGIVPQMDLETIRSLCKQGNDRRTSPPVETEFLREGRTLRATSAPVGRSRKSGRT